MTRLSQHSLTPSDFEAIEQAVMETEKGRWFLAEYARRHRSADTAAILEAVGKLEARLAAEGRLETRATPGGGDVRDALLALRRDLALLRPDAAGAASRGEDVINAVPAEAEAATASILGAAEKIQEIAWTMREGGIDEDICTALDELTATIYTACSLQDLGGRRLRRIAEGLHQLEALLQTDGAAEKPATDIARAQADAAPAPTPWAGVDTLRLPAPANPAVDALVEGDLDVGWEEVSVPEAELGERRFISPADVLPLQPDPDPDPPAREWPAAEDGGSDPVGRLTVGERLALFS